MTPLIPAKLVAVAATVGGLLIAAAAIVPAPWSVAVMIAGSLALFLAGQGAPQLSFAAGRPLVPMAAVPVLGTISGLLAQFAVTLPAANPLHSVLLLVAGVLAFLAGKAMPQPKVLEAEHAGDVAVEEVSSKEAKLKVLEGGADAPKDS